MLFEDEVVKANNKSTFVGHVLQCYLSLRRYVFSYKLSDIVNYNVNNVTYLLSGGCIYNLLNREKVFFCQVDPL